MCTESGMNTSILTEYVCEIRKAALLGNWARNMMLPFMLELTRFTCAGDDPRPFAVTVPLIRKLACPDGAGVSAPLMLVISSVLLLEWLAAVLLLIFF